MPERDRAGLVEEEDVDVAGGLDGASRRGDDVRLDHAVHPRDADRRQEAADRRGDQADEERDENGDRDRLSGAGGTHAEDREGKERDRRQEEDDRERGEQDVERDLVRRLLTLGAFDHRDHAIEEGLAGIGADPDDDPVREHACARDDGAAIAAGLADDGALSPVMAASFTEATPSMISPSHGDVVAGFDEDDDRLCGASAARPPWWQAASRRLLQPLRDGVTS